MDMCTMRLSVLNYLHRIKEKSVKLHVLMVSASPHRKVLAGKVVVS